MGKRRRSKHTEGQYWPLPYSTAQHPAFRQLSGPAVKILIELRCRYTMRGDARTDNNGTLALSQHDAARLLHMSKATVHRALLELEAAGFIVKMKQGQWYGRQATEWRVTDKSCDGMPPTRDWERIWKAQNLEHGTHMEHNRVATASPRYPSKFDGSA
ncbi:helix-turn-helix domain-containing protein [Acuticoccus yangtzensis]|uniref:helix-turn-helix domain-containing protein n=1 Tax=Acuticoccus yangtzensis TaxID=1443441 RepID=UPI00094991A7|nr:helix-turn-helix domain-containing protein [Acuticoccus yangtzensis]